MQSGKQRHSCEVHQLDSSCSWEVCACHCKGTVKIPSTLYKVILKNVDFKWKKGKKRVIKKKGEMELPFHKYRKKSVGGLD